MIVGTMRPHHGKIKLINRTTENVKPDIVSYITILIIVYQWRGD
jgi:hypothetical protein